MNRNFARICLFLFITLCIALLISINLIPRGNFIAAAAITMLIYLPLLIIQISLMAVLLVVEKTAIRVINVSFYLGFFITLVFIYFFCNFIMTTS